MTYIWFSSGIFENRDPCLSQLMSPNDYRLLLRLLLFLKRHICTSISLVATYTPLSLPGVTVKTDPGQQPYETFRKKHSGNRLTGSKHEQYEINNWIFHLIKTYRYLYVYRRIEKCHIIIYG